MLHHALMPWAVGYLGVLSAIVGVDYFLGATAEYLNAYEIVRLSFARSLPMTSERYLLGQDRLGSVALGVGWMLYLLEGALVTTLIRALWSWLAR